MIEPKKMSLLLCFCSDIAFWHWHMPSLRFILVLTEQTPHIVIIFKALDLFVSRLYGTACLVIGTCGERTGFMFHESDGLHFSKHLNDALFTNMDFKGKKDIVSKGKQCIHCLRSDVNSY